VGQCSAPHPDGFGQNYQDCSALGTPGNAATYTETMAEEAATAYGLSGGTLYTGTCNGGQSAIASASSSACVTWCYTGTCAGYAYASNTSTCYCPTPSVNSGSWK
jgi:hypothetical protein